MKLSARFIITAALALPLGTVTSAALATEAVHDHGNASVSSMELNQGQKWETDAPLRQGMSAMHGIVTTALADAHANKLTPEGYQGVSKNIMTQFTYVVENCKLEPAADAQLHVLLGNIAQGVGVLEGKVPGEKPDEGLVKIAKTLNNYGTHFNHTGWADIDLAH